MKDKTILSIGELAADIGVTVRTLQYYDRIGLLRSQFNESGRRVYSKDDIFKLQQIIFLKSLGFSLKEINEQILKADSISDAKEVFLSQRQILSQQMDSLNEIIKTLDAVILEIGKGKKISLDKLTAMIYLMKKESPYAFVLSYLKEEQLKKINERYKEPDAQENGEDILFKTQSIFTELNTLYKKGADPAGKEGQDLAKKWWDMVTEFADGDQGLLATLINVGADIEKWPEETKTISEAIDKFLKIALGIYFKNNSISINELEVKGNE